MSSFGRRPLISEREVASIKCALMGTGEAPDSGRISPDSRAVRIRERSRDSFGFGALAFLG